jgi:uncharacterized membrane protein YecN with MAPEG domain
MSSTTVVAVGLLVDICNSMLRFGRILHRYGYTDAEKSKTKLCKVYTMAVLVIDIDT